MILYYYILTKWSLFKIETVLHIFCLSKFSVDFELIFRLTSAEKVIEIDPSQNYAKHCSDYEPTLVKWNFLQFSMLKVSMQLILATYSVSKYLKKNSTLVLFYKAQTFWEGHKISTLDLTVCSKRQI